MYNNSFFPREHCNNFGDDKTYFRFVLFFNFRLEPVTSGYDFRLGNSQFHRLWFEPKLPIPVFSIHFRFKFRNFRFLFFAILCAGFKICRWLPVKAAKCLCKIEDFCMNNFGLFFRDPIFVQWRQKIVSASKISLFTFFEFLLILLSWDLIYLKRCWRRFKLQHPRMKMLMEPETTFGAFEADASATAATTRVWVSCCIAAGFSAEKAKFINFRNWHPVRQLILPLMTCSLTKAGSRLAGRQE